MNTRNSESQHPPVTEGDNNLMSDRSASWAYTISIGFVVLLAIACVVLYGIL